MRKTLLDGSAKYCDSTAHQPGEPHGNATAAAGQGYENADELLQSLDIAAECAEELRMPLPVSEREQAEADARDRAEARFEQRRDA